MGESGAMVSLATGFGHLNNRCTVEREDNALANVHTSTCTDIVTHTHRDTNMYIQSYL